MAMNKNKNGIDANSMLPSIEADDVFYDYTDKKIYICHIPVTTFNKQKSMAVYDFYDIKERITHAVEKLDENTDPNLFASQIANNLESAISHTINLEFERNIYKFSPKQVYLLLKAPMEAVKMFLLKIEQEYDKAQKLRDKLISENVLQDDDIEVHEDPSML